MYPYDVTFKRHQRVYRESFLSTGLQLPRGNPCWVSKQLNTHIIFSLHKLQHCSAPWGFPPTNKQTIHLFVFFSLFFWLHWVFVAVCGLSLVAPRHVGFQFTDRAQTCVPGIGRQTLNHQNTKEAPTSLLSYGHKAFHDLLQPVAYGWSRRQFPVFLAQTVLQGPLNIQTASHTWEYIYMTTSQKGNFQVDSYVHL